MSSYNFARLSVPAKQKERYLTFIDDYYNFIGEIPESKYRKELDAVNRRAQKAIGRDVVEVDEAEMTEKDFAKERRKVQKQAKRTENN